MNNEILLHRTNRPPRLRTLLGRRHRRDRGPRDGPRPADAHSQRNSSPPSIRWTTRTTSTASTAHWKCPVLRIAADSPIVRAEVEGVEFGSSVYDDLRFCWRSNRGDWNKAAPAQGEAKGYADHKSLAAAK